MGIWTGGGWVRRLTGHALLQAAIVALWMGMFLLARLLEHAPHASLWFPPAAVTFAALLVIGPRALPAILVSCTLATFLAEMQYGSALRPGVLAWSSFAFAGVHAIAYGVPAMVLRRLAHDQPVDVTLRSVTYFLLLGLAGATLAAVGGVAALSATGMIQVDAPGPLMAAWWMGDFVALLTLGPILIRLMVRAVGATGARGAWSLSPFQVDPVPTSARAWTKLAGLGGITAVMLIAAHAFETESLMLALLVVPLILQLWIVHTESRAAALLGVVLFSLLTVGAGALFEAGIDVVTLKFAAIALAAHSYYGLAVPALYATNERLRDQVTRDRLTRVMTRAYFEDRVQQELGRALAEHRPLAMIMFDLDRLKAINDTHGHAVGDAVLAELAARCAAVLAPGDLIGRLSGDEFAVALPNADARLADVVIDRMRAALAASPFAGPVGEVTASFGCAVCAPGTDTVADLLRRADVAMYSEKRRSTGPVDS